jgi:autotransporter-associated beta strand protein
MKTNMNNQRTPRQNPARGTLAKPVAALITALFGALLLGGIPVQATTITATNFWTATSEADWNVAGDWTPATVPNSAATFAVETNSVACDYSAGDTNLVGGLCIATNYFGTVTMSGVTLNVSNNAGIYIFEIGGGNLNASALTASLGGPGIGSFTMSGGTLNVERNSGTYQNDSFILGLATGSSGTFSISGGTANIWCGMEIGCEGAGTLNVSGGVLIDTGWFHIGEGINSIGKGGNGSGTFNMMGGALYILPNNNGGTGFGDGGGLTVGLDVTNVVANISGGTIYCCAINMSDHGGTVSNVLNISGGTIYVGGGGVAAQSYSNTFYGTNIINISGGTFHTADMLTYGLGGGLGDTNNVLSDGTNWTWGPGAGTIAYTAAAMPVNLTNTPGPGYVTFAPEANRTITLNNVWSGPGGMTFAGPGRVVLNNLSTYTGNTIVSGGTLSIGPGGFSGSPEVIIAGGAIFDLTTHPLTLAANLTITNSGSPAILAGTINSGLATAALTYTAGTPSVDVADGTLTISSTTPFNINITGSQLGPGTYTIIGTTNVSITNNVTMDTNGIVTGMVPTNCTVGGFGVSGTSYQLIISTSNTLDLVVFGPVVSPIISSPAVNGSGNPTFSGTAASGLTVYGVESTTSLTGTPKWIEATNVTTLTAPGVTTGSDGSWSFTDANQTNPPTIFYRLYYPDSPGSPPQ